MQEAFPFSAPEQHNGIRSLNLCKGGQIHSKKSESENIAANLLLCLDSQEGQTQRNENEPSPLYGWQATRAPKCEQAAS